MISLYHCSCACKCPYSEYFNTITFKCNVPTNNSRFFYITSGLISLWSLNLISYWKVHDKSTGWESRYKKKANEEVSKWGFASSELRLELFSKPLISANGHVRWGRARALRAGNDEITPESGRQGGSFKCEAEKKAAVKNDEARSDILWQIDTNRRQKEGESCEQRDIARLDSQLQKNKVSNL